jgi:hypothetical protein
VFGVFTYPPDIKVICYTANNPKTRTLENEANARLIAAAPELLDLAGRCLLKLNDRPGDLIADELRSELRAVIAKVEGYWREDPTS